MYMISVALITLHLCHEGTWSTRAMSMESGSKLAVIIFLPRKASNSNYFNITVCVAVFAVFRVLCKSEFVAVSALLGMASGAIKVQF